MKNKISILFYFFLAFNFSSVRVNAQSGCNCWQPLDTSYHPVHFRHGTTGPPYYRNDDGYTNLITIPFSFCFYGDTVNQIFINNNGFITWGPGHATVNGQYDADTFPSNVADIIAPFWADVDTRPRRGIVWYKQTLTYYIVRWDSVGGYGLSSSLDDNFEVIVSDGSDPIIPGGNNIEFCYGDMQWCVGTASGSSGNGFGSTTSSSFDYPAVVGINERRGGGNIQYGLFNNPNSNYYGGYPPFPYDGLYWLNNKQFIMNGCTGNSPPTLSGLTLCRTDTFTICEGDTLKIPLNFYSIVSGVTVNSNLTPPILPGVSIIYNNSTGQHDSLVVQVIGNTSNLGYNTIDLYGYDNLSPSDTNFASFVIDVLPPPAVTISASPDTVCLGNSSVLTAGGGVNFSWSTGDTTSSITVSPSLTTTYSVSIGTAGCTKDTTITVVVEPRIALTVTPSNTGACAGTSITLTASGSTNYTWTPNSGLSCYSCTSPIATPTATTVYTVTTTAHGCVTDTTDTVYVYPIPTMTITSTRDSICAGDSVNLSISGTATSYTWTPSSGLSCTNCANPIASPTVNTVYTVRGSTVYGCSSTASVSIHVIPLPVLYVPPYFSICPGQSVSLFAFGNGDSYTWNPGNETGPSITVSPTSYETYTVTMTSFCGTLTGTVTVNVNPLPVPSFEADITSGCPPLCIQFRNTSTIAAGSITSWIWNFGGKDTSNSKNPIYCYLNPGVYSVQINATSDSGCSASLTTSDLITVYSIPKVNFTASPQPTTFLQPTIYFTNTTTDAYGIAGMIWTFGDGSDSISYTDNPSHLYQDTGTYCVHLTVTNDHGCQDSATDCIAISPIFTLYIPEAFSPNGDGINDLFKIKGNYIRSFEMYIYDRWGQKLYHTTDINAGWNGEIDNSGVICQEDAYVYVITVYDSKDAKHSYTGTLNLLK